MIRVFVTGGTFDKTYDEIQGKLRDELDRLIAQRQ